MVVKEKLSLVDRFKRLIAINKKRHDDAVSQKSEHELNLAKGKARRVAAKKLKSSVQKACRVQNRNK